MGTMECSKRYIKSANIVLFHYRSGGIMGEKMEYGSNAIYKSFSGELRILAERDKWRQKVELWLLNGENNRNNWRYENLEEHKELFADTPILVAYVGDKVGDGHNFREVYNPDGTVTASFMSSTAERIVGYFKNTDDIRMEEKDGEKWIVGVGYLWTWYAQELVEKLKKQGLEGMSVSIETLVLDGHQDGAIEVYTKYQILGTTILGDDVAPAVAEANIRALSAMGINEIKKQTLRVASFNQEQKQNPQQTKTKKENKTTMKIKDLKGYFEGFKVCQVDGEKVALLSNENGNAYVSTAVADNGKIVEGVKTAVNASVVFGEGENEIKVALDSIVDEYNTEIANLQAQLKECKESKEAVEKSLKTMQDNEITRRKQAVISAIKARFAEIKEHSTCEFAENECDDLLTDECIGKYSEMEVDGKFVGEEKARCDVDAKCMSRIIASDKVKKNSMRTYAWENIGLACNDEPVDGVKKAVKNIIED